MHTLNAGRLWISNNNKELEKDHLEQQDAGVARYFSTKKLFMEYLLNEEERLLIPAILEALNEQIGWLLAHWNLDGQPMHWLTLLTTGVQYSLSTCRVVSQVGHNNSIFKKGNLLESLQL